MNMDSIKFKLSPFLSTFMLSSVTWVILTWAVIILPGNLCHYFPLYIVFCILMFYLSHNQLVPISFNLCIFHNIVFVFVL
jgi:hypothetical protein